MLAVCAKASAEDTTFIKNDLRQKKWRHRNSKRRSPTSSEIFARKATIVYK